MYLCLQFFQLSSCLCQLAVSLRQGNRERRDGVGIRGVLLSADAAARRCFREWGAVASQARGGDKDARWQL